MKRAPLIFDVLCLVLFVAIGRSAHQHGVTFAGMASTLWPFAVGLLVGWLVALRSRGSLAAPMSGAIVVLATVAIGMVLRVVAGQGTAFAFVVVALAFLGLFLVGWRVLATMIARR